MMNLSDFADSLKELILEKDITKVMLTKEVGLQLNTILKYLSGDSMPSIENLTKLSEYFGCSYEFLLGRSDETKKSFYKLLPFAESLKLLLNYLKITVIQFSKETGISLSCIFYWLTSKRRPGLDNIIKIADCYGLTVDFVLGREN